MSPAENSPAPLSFGDLIAWMRRHPAEAALLALLLVGMVYYFCFYKVFYNGNQSAMMWAASAWNGENDLEYGAFIFPAAVVIAWVHRDALRAAPKSVSWAGLVIAFFGALLFVLSVRSLQPRIALLALPVLFYGGVRFLWGGPTARLIIFPSLFLLFMVPAGFIISRTVGLQTLAATVAAKLSGLLGIGVMADGTTLHALDGSFPPLEVAGGCSGIRSLTAMTMLAAVYVHFTQRELWKKAVIFCGSLFFALLGNLARIFSVVLFAHFINPGIAVGLYHDWSGFIFFPIAVFSMLSVSNLLNRDWSDWVKPEQTPMRPSSSPARGASEPAKPSPISYDY